MKIGIVGAGVTGTYLGILLSKSHPEDEITLLEKNDKVNRKIYATGNGRCNLGNMKIKDFSYSNFKYVKKYLDKYNLDTQRRFLSSLGIETFEEDNLIYPFSNSSKQVGTILSSFLNANSVKILRNCSVFDYYIKNDKVILKTDLGEKEFDKVIFTTGAKSSPKFGSTGDLYSIFEKHNYEIKPLKPGLCPIKIKENVREIEGNRVKARVTVYQNNKVIHKEEGEVLFKIDGLSGIVIMNCASIIARLANQKNIKISLNLVDVLSTNFESNLIKNSKVISNPLNSYFPPQLSNYIKKFANLKYFDEKNVKMLVKSLKNFEFTFKDFYSFDNSQVSVGGISFNNLKEDLSSKIEKNIYFAGEIIDADGLCGGFNLMWCLASAMKINESI